MTREQLWKIYTDKNPQFLNEEAIVQLPVRGLKKLFEQTWDQAQKHKSVTSAMDDFFNLAKKK